MWYQHTITLSEKPCGFHWVTDEIFGIDGGSRKIIATLQEE